MKLVAAIIVACLFLPGLIFATWFMLMFPTLHLTRACVQPFEKICAAFPPLDVRVERVWEWLGIDRFNYR